MKKLIVGILTVIILFINLGAYAEGDITFQNVPWLSDEATTLQVLSENGLVRSGFVVPAFSGETGYYIASEEILGYCPMKNDYYKEVSHAISLAGKTKGKIAGSVIKDIILTYAYDGNDSKLIAVKVQLNDIGYQTIKEKLETVYGTSTKTEVDDFEMSIWKGDHDSAVILFSDNDGVTYQLIYGRLDAEQILNDCKDTYYSLSDPNDISGL